MSSSRFAMALGAIALCVALSGAVLAQDAREYDQSAPAQVSHAVSVPFKGEVTCDRLSVRIFPKADEKTKVVTVFKRGHEVNVVGESGEFWAITPWDDAGDCYIWAKNVERNGDEATVTVDSAPVRWDTRTNAEKLCDLPKGTKAHIVAALHSNTWYEIKPPAGVSFYVAKKYVKKTGDATPSVAAPILTPTPEADLNADAREWMTKANREAQTQIDAWQAGSTPDFTSATSMYKTAADKAHDENLKLAAHSLITNLEGLQVVAASKGTDAAAIARLRADYEKRIKDLNTKIENVNKPKAHIRQGYLEMVGLLPNRPGDYRLLTPEGSTICYLKFPADPDAEAALRVKLEGHYHHWMAFTGTVLPPEMQYEGCDVIVIDDAWQKTPMRPLIER